MKTNKEFLRDKYRKLRQSLTIDEMDGKSLSIANLALKLPVWDRQYYHVFLPILRQNEVNTEYILHLLAGKDKDVVISKSDFSTREMTHYLLTDSTTIRTNTYGIPEPENGIEVPVEKIDVVFVPLLAYDKAGNRVGYGKGFYDRFLSKCSPDTVKIGVSFFGPETACEDVLESDIKLDYCITPDQVYRF